MPILEHRGECAGTWTYLAAERVIACGGCGRRYVSTRERRFVAAFDEILGDHMRRLATEGAAMLDAERGG
jgi:hypothetical protein